MDTNGSGVEIKNRYQRCKTYDDIFLGDEFSSWLVVNKHAANLQEAIMIGQKCIDYDLLIHSLRDHPFKNEPLFYHFVLNDKSKGFP
jgi:hypothetical protein